MSLERSFHAADDGQLAAFDVDLDHARLEPGRLDLGVDRRDLDVNRLALREASGGEARERRVGRPRHVELRTPRRVADGLRDDEHVRAAVQRDVRLELCARRRVRLEREHAARPGRRRCDCVEPDVRADVDEVADAKARAHEPELALVVEPEEEVALERLPQVEPQPESAREARDRLARLAHADDAADPAFAAEVGVAEDRE